ncbi:uncharacterized protein DFL_007635 [Arthrobotrys flagrans]|uniref:Uncharacterized protein n=1 Tax=Arthrobotrys flagrans TaxID=97331 RepID=A0A436ZWH7_ARTFL|nr:hypothetical protein DFL_007635 [Arthrobotrys flagrans]
MTRRTLEIGCPPTRYYLSKTTSPKNPPEASPLPSVLILRACSFGGKSRLGVQPTIAEPPQNTNLPTADASRKSINGNVAALPSQQSFDKATVANRVLSGRVQNRRKKVIRKPPMRKQSQVLLAINSSTPGVFNKSETFPWGFTQFTYPDGTVADSKSAVKPLYNQPSIEVPFEAVTTEKFRIVALLANEIKNLFPGENYEYWCGVINGFRRFERRANQNRRDLEANADCYHGQLNLVRGIYPTLEKSITGYSQLYSKLGQQRSNNRQFASVQVRLWGMTYHTESISDLRRQFLSRYDGLRRFHLALSRIKAFSFDDKTLDDIFKMSAFAYEIAEGLQRLVDELLKVKQFMIDNKVQPSQSDQLYHVKMARYKIMARRDMAGMSASPLRPVSLAHHGSLLLRSM